MLNNDVKSHLKEGPVKPSPARNKDNDFGPSQARNKIQNHGPARNKTQNHGPKSFLFSIPVKIA